MAGVNDVSTRYLCSNVHTIRYWGGMKMTMMMARMMMARMMMPIMMKSVMTLRRSVEAYPHRDNIVESRLCYAMLCCGCPYSGNTVESSSAVEIMLCYAVLSRLYYAVLWMSVSRQYYRGDIFYPS